MECDVLWFTILTGQEHSDESCYIEVVAPVVENGLNSLSIAALEKLKQDNVIRNRFSVITLAQF